MPRLILVIDSVYDQNIMSPAVQHDLRQLHKDSDGGNDWYYEYEWQGDDYPILNAWIKQYLDDNDYPLDTPVALHYWW